MKTVFETIKKEFFDGSFFDKVSIIWNIFINVIAIGICVFLIYEPLGIFSLLGAVILCIYVFICGVLIADDWF